MVQIHSTSERCTGIRYCIALALLVACMVAVIEVRHPFFFLRDDNLHQNLPYYVHNYRSALSCEVPLFNFHQFLGIPSLACIQPAAFYLPNYAAVFLSSLFFGHYYATMEFIAVFHLILAAIGFFKLMRHFDLEDWSCCFGAISWAFCGFVMTVGNSWITVVCYAAYFPWLLLYSFRQMGPFNLRNFSILVALRMTMLFIGYPPYIIYAYTFEILAVVALRLVSYDLGTTRGESFVSFLMKHAFGCLCAFLLAAPLLLPALHLVAISADRKSALPWEEYSSAAYDPVSWLHGQFTPLADPFLKNTSWFQQPFISHIGWLTLIFCIMAICRRCSQMKTALVFLALAIVSFLWACDTFVTGLFYHIPFYNRQRWPFKLMFFNSFFLIAVSSFGFDCWRERLKGYAVKYRTICMAVLPFLLLIHIANFLLLYLAVPQRRFHVRSVQLPVFEEPLADVLKQGRIISIIHTNAGGVPGMPSDDSLVDNTLMLGYNYATLFGLYHFTGHELLVPDRNLKASHNIKLGAFLGTAGPLSLSSQELEYFRKWGVKWYVLDRNIPFFSQNELKIAHRDNYRTVLYDEGAKPFVYWRNTESENGIKYNFTTNSIRIESDRDGSGDIVVNVLHDPFFQLKIDDRKEELQESVDNQMIVPVPSGRHLIRITYVDPYFYNGLYISCGFLAIVAGILLFRRLKGGLFGPMPSFGTVDRGCNE